MLTNGFSSSQVWMWELDHKENWAPKNWCFWMVVLEKTLESPLDCKIKLVSSEYSLEGLVLKLKLQYFWPPDVKTWLIWKCWERLKAGGEGDDSGWDGWMASLTWVWASSRSWWWTGKTGVLQSMVLQRAGHDCETELTLCRPRPNKHNILWGWYYYYYYYYTKSTGKKKIWLTLIRKNVEKSELHRSHLLFF